MRRTLAKKSFFALYFIQILILLLTAYWWYDIAKSGQEIKFPIKSATPRELLHGNYIYLNFTNNTIAQDMPDANTKFLNKQILVSFAKDEQGFATPHKVSEDAATNPYVNASALNAVNGILYIRYPFNKYYVNEALAKKIMGLAVEKKLDNAYALVMVKNGHAVVKDVYINNQPIESYLQENLK